MTLPRLLALFVGLALAVHLYSNRGMPAGDPRHGTGSDGIVMLSADWCGYCRALRADLERDDASAGHAVASPRIDPPRRLR